MIVVVLGDSTENPQVAPEIGLLVRRHDAAQRRSQLHDPDAPTHFEGPLQPAILDETLYPRCGLDDNVRAKAAGIDLRVWAGECAQVGERPTRQDVNARRLEERSRRQ